MPRARKSAAAAKATEEIELERMREEEEEDLKDYLKRISSDAPVRINICRIYPKTWKNVNTGGSLETVDELIDEEYVRERWGGGKYQLKIQRVGSSGSYKYYTAKNIEIAGPPNLEALMDASSSEPSEPAESLDATLVKSTVGTLERARQDAEKRAEKAEHASNKGIDFTALRAFQEPLLQQLQAAQAETAELRKMLLQLQSAPKEDTATTQILHKMVDSESVRIQSLTAQHQSEIRQMRDNHTSEMQYFRDQTARDKEALVRASEREVETLQKMFEGRIETLNVAHSTKIDVFKTENARLLEEIHELRTKIGTLEAKKEKTITEQAEEVAQFQQTMTSLGFAKGEGESKSDEPTHWLAKVVEKVGEAPALMELLGGVRERMSTTPQQPAQLQAPARARRPVVRGPNGERFVVAPNGQLVPIPRRAKGPDIEAPEETGEETSSEARPPDGTEVTTAVRFLEAAIQNGTSPEEFAASARNLIPSDILEYINRVGVDAFLQQVAPLETGSPLTSQYGRNYARAVARFLATGSTEEIAVQSA